MNPKFNSEITVLIPVYNSRQFVARTLDSVLKQTLKNFKVIIIDDCSSDDTYDYVCNYVKSDQRVIVRRNERNLGLGLTRKKLVQLVTTDFFIFIDDDDFLYPSALEKMLNKMKSGPDFDFVVSKSKFGFKLKNFFLSLPFMQQKYRPVSHPLKWYCDNWVYWWGTLFKTEFVKMQGDGVWWKDNRYEDVIPLCKLFINAKKIGFWNGYAIQYLRRKSSITSTNSASNVIANLRAIINIYAELFKLQKNKVNDLRWRQQMIDSKYSDLVLIFCLHYLIIRKIKQTAFFDKQLQQVKHLKNEYNATFITKKKWLSCLAKMIYHHVFKQLR